MKKLLLLFILTFFTISCETEESDLTLQDSSHQTLSKLATEIIESGYFGETSNFNRNNDEKRSSNSNGAFIAENQGGIFFGFGFGTGVLFLQSDEASFKILPNGLMQLKLDTSDPSMFIFDFRIGGFGNDCYEDKPGHLTINVTGSYFIDETPWGTFYRLTLPLKSSGIFKATNVKLNDESATYNEETGEFLYCNDDATREIVLDWKLIDKLNNEGNAETIFEIKIDGEILN